MERLKLHKTRLKLRRTDMLTNIYDRQTLLAELDTANPGYFDHPGYTRSGDTRILAAQPEISRTDNLVWLVIRRSHRKTVLCQYLRDQKDMTQGSRRNAVRWQRYSVRESEDYIVVSAAMNTGKITEHDVYSTRLKAISAARDGAGIPKRHRTSRNRWYPIGD